ncbi:hypothetical protein Hanom_Chr09g00869591 [Helianthus anomalus]
MCEYHATMYMDYSNDQDPIELLASGIMCFWLLFSVFTLRSAFYPYTVREFIIPFVLSVLLKVSHLLIIFIFDQFLAF